MIVRVNQYTLRAKLGNGSAARVHLGVCDVTGAHFAVKQFNLATLARRSGGLALDQFSTELRWLRRLRHPNIPRFIEALFVSDMDMCFVVTEYCDGGSLKGARLTEEAALSVVKAVGAALAYLHDSGLVHGDVKPGNVLISGGVPKLSDFGQTHGFASSAQIYGTAGFRAPEFAADDGTDSGRIEGTGAHGERLGVSKAAALEDVWALGATMWALMWGRPPFDGGDDDSYLGVPHGRDGSCLLVPQCASKELLSGMLAVDPAKRLTLSEVLAHPLVANAASTVGIAPLPLPAFKQGRITPYVGRIIGPDYRFMVQGSALTRSWTFICESQNAPESERRSSDLCPLRQEGCE